ncbi:hypothetical protein KCU65_g406, partial [Aureobasidium melanogenum]
MGTSKYLLHTIMNPISINRSKHSSNHFFNLAVLASTQDVKFTRNDGVVDVAFPKVEDVGIGTGVWTVDFEICDGESSDGHNVETAKEAFTRLGDGAVEEVQGGVVAGEESAADEVDVIGGCTVVFGVVVAQQNIPGDGSGRDTVVVYPSGQTAGGVHTLIVETFALSEMIVPLGSYLTPTPKVPWRLLSRSSASLV